MCNRPGLVWKLPVKRRPSLIGFGNSDIDGLLSPVSIIKCEKGTHLSKDPRDRGLVVEHVIEVEEAGIETGIANRGDDCGVIAGELAHIYTRHGKMLLSADRVRLSQFTGHWHKAYYIRRVRHLQPSQRFSIRGATLCGMDASNPYVPGQAPVRTCDGGKLMRRRAAL
jgi:hypothetical protein